jgi:hypothetical protein
MDFRSGIRVRSGATAPDIIEALDIGRGERLSPGLLLFAVV